MPSFEGEVSKYFVVVLLYGLSICHVCVCIWYDVNVYNTYIRYKCIQWINNCSYHFMILAHAWFLAAGICQHGRRSQGHFARLLFWVQVLATRHCITQRDKLLPRALWRTASIESKHVHCVRYFAILPDTSRGDFRCILATPSGLMRPRGCQSEESGVTQ